MERNPNSWKIIAMFFMMAMLFAMGPINAVNVNLAKEDVQFSTNSPPDVQTIAIVNEIPETIVAWIAKSTPGVCYSYSTTITAIKSEVVDVLSTSISYNLFNDLTENDQKNKRQLSDRFVYRQPRDGLRQS